MRNCHFYRNSILISLFALLIFPSISTANVPTYPEVTFILDASGSMWGKAGNKTKIESAKMVMSQIVPALAPEIKVGLVAYGHRRKGDCKDIEVLIKAGSDDRKGLLNKVKALQPKGKTPISDAISMTVEQLKIKENETTIVLVSDGIETCAADPCKLIKDLKNTGIKFVLHVVGFGVSDEGTHQLTCLAQAGGGKYMAANDTDSLLKALNLVSKEIDKKVEVEKAKSIQVKASTGLGKIKLSMPESTRKGMAGLKIIRVKDGKKVKETKRLAAETIHPLMAGVYEIEYLFGTPNYGDPSVTNIGKVTVTGGQTKEIILGGIVFNIAEALGKNVYLDHVFITESGSGKTVVTVHDNNNGYYNFKPKAILPGKYDIKFHYSHSPAPTTVATDVIVKPGEETVITLDSGIVFKKVTSTDITGWDLICLSTTTKADTIEDDDSSLVTAPLLQARPPSGNKTTLWSPYIVQAGKYRLIVHVEGMNEPLPIAEELTIQKGQTLNFDSGL